jgi:DNA-directed RNA polymerase specialized sigma24 family protein
VLASGDAQISLETSSKVAGPRPANLRVTPDEDLFKKVVFVMMDKQQFTSLYNQYAELVRRVCGRRGLTGADLDEVSQEVWTDLWKRRAVWPDPGPENPGAYVAQCAKRKAKMHFRAAGTLKRGAFHEPLEEDRTSAANIKISKPPEAERLVEQTSLGTLLRRLAKRVGGEQEQVMLDRLDKKKDHPPLADEPSAVRLGFRRMVAACRRQLGIPTEEPRTAGVDPLTHLTGVVRRFTDCPDPEPLDAE